MTRNQGSASKRKGKSKSKSQRKSGDGKARRGATRRPDGPEGSSGKRRSFSQRVGTKGELAFRVFAEAHGLLATKCEEDFGIDFMCQVDLGADSRGASDIANTLVGCCVRATTSSDKKVKLNVGDARNLLNSRTPLIFILVALDQGGVPSVHHRLVDADFSDELTEFLAGTAAEMTVTADRCANEDDFDADLQTCLGHGFSETIRLGLAERRLSKILPAASVEIQRSPQGQLTLVETVHMFDYYESGTPEQERAIVHAAFGSIEHGADRFRALVPKPEVLKYLRNLPAPTVLSGFLSESSVELQCSSAFGTVNAEFVLRRTRTHWAYVHSSGLSLITSHAKLVEGKRVHETEVFIDPLVDTKMEDLGSFANFLIACGPGSTIVPLGDDGKPDGAGFATDATFAPLHTVARFVASWRRCATIEGWPRESVSLRDVTDAEVFHSLTGVAAMLTDDRVIARYSFYLAPAQEDRGVQDLSPAPVRASLPVIANLSGDTVLVRFNVTASTLSLDGEVCGMRFHSVQGAVAEKRALVQKSTIFPEAIYGGNDTTTAFGPDLQEGRVPSEIEAVSLNWDEGDDD